MVCFSLTRTAYLHMATKTHSVVIAAVGDGGVGKTCLLLTFLTGKYPDQYLPGAMEWNSEYSHVTEKPVHLQYEGKEVSLTLVDTVGLDEYQRLRGMVCAKADVYLLCYDVTIPSTMERVEHHWLPEIKEYSNTAPYVLVGMKTDERTKIDQDSGSRYKAIPTEEGVRMAQRLGAFGYVECSAKKGRGIRRVFENAALAYLDTYMPDNTRKKSCVIS